MPQCGSLFTEPNELNLLARTKVLAASLGRSVRNPLVVCTNGNRRRTVTPPARSTPGQSVPPARRTRHRRAVPPRRAASARRRAEPDPRQSTQDLSEIGTRRRKRASANAPKRLPDERGRARTARRPREHGRAWMMARRWKESKERPCGSLRRSTCCRSSKSEGFWTGIDRFR